MVRHNSPTDLYSIFTAAAEKLQEGAVVTYRNDDKPPLLWETFAPSLPLRFCIEPLFISWRNSLILCGPRTEADISIVVIRLKNIPPAQEAMSQQEEEEASVLDSDGGMFEHMQVDSIEGWDVAGPNCPDAKIIFRKAPLYFIEDDQLYMGFIDGIENRFQFLKIDLNTKTMVMIKTANTPQGNHAIGYEGVYWHGHFYLLTSPTNLHRLSFDILTWETFAVPIDASPGILTVSSLLWNNKLWSFGSTQTGIHCLDLTTRTWERIPIARSGSFHTRDSHMSRLVGDRLYMVRVYDRSALYYLDLKKMEWIQEETIGCRPLGFTNNPSTAILGDYLFCAGYNQIIKPVNYPNPGMRPNPPAQPAPAPAPLPVAPPNPPAAAPRGRRSRRTAGNRAAGAPQANPIPAPPPPPPPVAPPQPAPGFPALLFTGEVEILKIRLTRKRSTVTEIGRLTNQMSSRFEDLYTDVTFKLGKEEKVLKAHRTILSAVPWFADLFQKRFPNQSEIAFPQYPFDEFKAVVEYLYERPPPTLEDRVNLMQVYLLAEEFAITKLKRIVLNLICSQEGNAEKVLDVFFGSRDLTTGLLNDTLKRKAEVEVQKNFAKIAKTQRFKTLLQEDPQAAANVFAANADD